MHQREPALIKKFACESLFEHGDTKQSFTASHVRDTGPWVITHPNQPS